MHTSDVTAVSIWATHTVIPKNISSLLFFKCCDQRLLVGNPLTIKKKFKTTNNINTVSITDATNTSN